MSFLILVPILIVHRQSPLLLMGQVLEMQLTFMSHHLCQLIHVRLTRLSLVLRTFQLGT